LAVLEGFVEADVRQVATAVVERADGVERVDESSDGVEVHVRRQGGLVECADGARLGLAERLVVDFVDESAE